MADLNAALDRIRTYIVNMNQALPSTSPGDTAQALADVEAVKNEIASTKAERDRFKAACIKQEFSISQTLGRALGYVEPDGTVNVCEHTAETLVMEAARELAVRDRAMELLDDRVIRVYECFDGCKKYKKDECDCTSAALAQARAEIAKEEKPEPKRDSTLSQAHVVSYGKEPEVKP